MQPSLYLVMMMNSCEGMWRPSSLCRDGGRQQPGTSLWEAKRSHPCHISHLTLLSNSLLQLFQVVQVNFQAQRLLGHPPKPFWCCLFSKLSRKMIEGRLRNRRRKIRAPESSLLLPSSAFLRAPCFSVFDLTGLVDLAMQKSQKVCF